MKLEIVGKLKYVKLDNTLLNNKRSKKKSEGTEKCLVTNVTKTPHPKHVMQQKQF